MMHTDMPKGGKRGVARKMVALPHLRESRSRVGRIADWCTSVFGTVPFLGAHIGLFTVWIFWNSNVIGVSPIDPYPFNFLTTVVSLEAIILSIVVLMSQNRAERIANIRDEIDLQVNIQSEREITKILEMLVVIEQKMRVKKIDPELIDMLRRVNLDELEARVLRAIERAEK